MLNASKLFATECPALTTRAVVLVIALMTVPVLAFVKIQRFAPTHHLLRDPLAVAESAPGQCCEPYFGLVSIIGTLLWAASGAVSLLAWLIIRSLPSMDQKKWFFFFAFVFSMTLCIDDTFMLHDVVIPRLGYPEVWGYALLGLVAVPYFISARFLLARRSGIMLCAALSFLGASLYLDMQTEASYIYEDGLKFAGIVSWTVFHFSIAIEEIHRRLSRETPSSVHARSLVQAAR